MPQGDRVMEPTIEQRQSAIGDEVVGSDEGKIGTVQAIGGAHITVEKGLIRKEHLYIPTAAINNVADGRVYLTVTKDDALNQGWDFPPVVPTEADGSPVGL
jgi:hypothetical protein